MSLWTQREALAAQIKANIERGINVVAYEVDPDMTDPPLPRVSVAVTEIDYFLTSTGNGYGEVRGEIRLELAAANLETAARMMSDFLDPQGDSSIQQAVHTDKTLGGTVQAARVLSASVQSPTEASVSIAWAYKKSGAQA